MAEAVTVIDITARVTDDTASGAASATEHVSKMEKAMSKMQSSIEKMQKMSRIEIGMYAVDKASKLMDDVWNTGKSLSGKVFSFTLKAVDLVTAPVRGVMNFISNPVMAAASVAGITLGVGDTINTFMDFEHQMSAVAATAMASQAELQALTGQARQLGADTAFSAIEVALGMENLASAGFTVDEILKTMPGLLDLAAASGENLARSSEIASGALRGFGLDVSEMEKVADVLASAAAETNASVNSIGEAFQYVAPNANAAGISFENTVAAIGLLANNMKDGSSAGTGLTAILTSITGRSDEASKLISELGIDFFDTERNAKDFTGIVSETEKAIAGMNHEQKLSALETIFGVQGGTAMNILLNETSDNLASLTDGFYDVTGASRETASIRMDNLKGTLEELGGAVDDFKLSIGEKAAPYIQQFASWLTDRIPSATEAAVRAFDWAEGKIKGLHGTIKEFTGTDEWADADFFGKISIAWDNLIAEPFSEWWDGKGKAKVASIAHDIGSGIGSTIKNGISALFGLDMSGAIDDGVSIGKSFTNGFTQGIEGIDWNQVMQGLSDAVVWSLKTAFSNPVTGTLAASFIGGKVLGGVSSGYQMFQGAKGILGTVLGVPGTSDGSPASLNMLGNAGLMKLGGIGTKLGSGATMTSGLAAAGAAGLAGGIIGGVTLISAGTDLYKGLKSADAAESTMYKESASQKANGVITGAAAGALVGSAVPVIGTAVGALAGAGIGGIAGWLQGNNTKQRYEQSMFEAEEAAKKLSVRQEQARYSSDSLRTAVQQLADGEIDSYTFMAIKQEEITKSISKRFGTVNLSLSEIQNIADGITFGSMKKGIESLSEASAEADSSLANLKGSSIGLERMNWKANLGIDYDMEAYKAGTDAFISNAKDYAESRQYEITLATKMSLGEDYDMTGLNNSFEKYKNKIDELGTELNAKFTIGVDAEFDAEGVFNLQNKISEMTSKMEKARAEADIDILKMQFGGDMLSEDAFNQITSKLQENAQIMEDELRKSHSNTAFGLRFAFNEGEISEDTYTKGLEAAQSKLETDLSKMSQNITDFWTGEIGEKFGVSATELTSSMQESMKSGISPTRWTENEVSKFLGLDSIESEARMGLAQMINRLAQSMPGMSVAEETSSLISGWKNSIEEKRTSLAGTPVEGLTGVYYPSTQKGWENWNVDVDSIRDMTPQGRNKLQSELIEQGYDGTFANGGIVGAYASGGIFNKRGLQSISNYTDSRGVMSAPHIGLVGEDGAEAIIPLSASRRARGLSLWEKAGEMLGVKPYAEGGIFGTPVTPAAAPIGGGGGGGMVAPITINSNPTLEIHIDSSMDENKIIQIIKNAAPKFADDMAGCLAEALHQQMANTPLSAWE